MINFKNEAIGLLCICHKLTYKHPEPQTATCKLYVMINFNSTFYIEFEIPSHINNFHFVLSSNKNPCPENSDTSKHLELFYNYLIFDYLMITFKNYSYQLLNSESIILIHNNYYCNSKLN